MWRRPPATRTAPRSRRWRPARRPPTPGAEPPPLARPPAAARAAAPARPLKDRVGAAGETAALGELRERGLTILARDWRCRLGQIDVVALDGDTVVIVEVKARRGLGFGLPQEAVDARKRRKLRLLAEAYLGASGRQGSAVRIDVLGMLLDSRLRVVSCEHIRDAVSGV